MQNSEFEINTTSQNMESIVPHSHAELIKKWADNPKLKFQYRYSSEYFWSDCPHSPAWSSSCEYRIKPKLIEVYKWVLFNPESKTYCVSNGKYSEDAVKTAFSFAQPVQKIDCTKEIQEE